MPSLAVLKRFIKYLYQGVPIINETANIHILSAGKSLIDMEIIITGGGTGLGYAMAKKFISEGAKVLITGRREDVLKAASEELGCSYAVLDVTKPDGFDQFFF